MGSPCSLGHSGLRLTSGGTCRDCAVVWLERRRRRQGTPKRHWNPSIERKKAQRSAINRRWRLAHPEQHAALNLAHRDKNLAHYRSLEKNRYMADPDKWIQRANNSRARRAGVDGSHTLEDRRRIFAEQDYRCRACGEKHRLTIDHMKPISRGGSNHPDNLQGLCRQCNASKGAKTMEEWIASGRAPAFCRQRGGASIPCPRLALGYGGGRSHCRSPLSSEPLPLAADCQ